MARCGCGGQCSCVVRGGTGIAVSGTGTPLDPYTISPVGIGKTLARVDAVGTNLVFVYTDGSVSQPVALPTTNLSTVADGAISTTKLVDAAVTQAKLANLSVGSAQLIDGAVTRAKMGANGFLLDRGQWAANLDYVVGDVVTQAGQRWVSIIAHRSPTTFSNLTWLPLSPVPPALRPLPYKITTRQPSDQNYAPTPSDYVTMPFMQTGPAAAFTVDTKCSISAGVIYAGNHSMVFRIVAFAGTVATRLWPRNSAGAANLAAGAGVATVGSGGSVQAFQWNVAELPVTLPAGTTSVGVQWSSVDNTSQCNTTDAHMSLTFGMES